MAIETVGKTDSLEQGRAKWNSNDVELKAITDANANNKAAANIGIGRTALDALTNADYNIAIGQNAAQSITTGSQNTYLGDNAATSHQTGANCIYMGHACNASSTSVDEEIVLGVGLTGKGTNTTFVAGTIATRPARNGDVAYGKAGVSVFNRDDAVQGSFGGSPDALITGLDQIKTLENGLQDIEAYVGTLSDKERWDALAAAIVEVVHIDPRDNGGYIITVGDLDIMSTAGTVDIYVTKKHESLVDFAVGSTLIVVGSPYMSRDDEAKLAVTGWWCHESMAASAPEQLPDEGGWD